MTSHFAWSRSEAPRPQWKLPNILEMRISLIPYQAPKLRHFESYLTRYTRAIEFLITTDGPFPVRALAPVLYVGEVPVVESEGVSDNVYRFLAFEFDPLKENAPISIGCGVNLWRNYNRRNSAISPHPSRSQTRESASKVDPSAMSKAREKEMKPEHSLIFQTS